MTKRTICPKCEAANARATEALGLLTHWQGRAADLERELSALVLRCDGPEGVRADGSNIQTISAHALLEAGQ